MSANQWDPGQYMMGTMGDLRTRPALDLLARVVHAAPARVVDLGCGPGNSTLPLKARWPDASVTGVDNSPAMLEKARATGAPVDWQGADIATWAPPEPVDVIFSNAAFHWVADHAALFRRLVGCLAPRGVLAVQMPNNFGAPSHTLIAEIAEDERWRDRLAGRLVGEHVENARFYHDVLRALPGTPDIWETEYLQPLTGADPVLEWVRGTALLPVQRELPADDFTAFTGIYRQRLRQAYPVAADGITLFPFRRMFITFTRAA